jgi:hypothetical protein
MIAWHLTKRAEATVATGYSNAGQVCISTQRVIALAGIYDDLLTALRPKVEGITVGNPLDEKTKMGPMVRQADAERVESWVNEAVAQGAKLVTGGHRHGAIYEPTLVADVDPRWHQLPGAVSAVAVTRAASIERDSPPTTALRPGADPPRISPGDEVRPAGRVRQLHVNWGPQWRGLIYGGLRRLRKKA